MADDSAPARTGSVAVSATGPTRSAVGAAITDLLAVALFVAIGRRSHDEGFTIAGYLHSYWPFATGAAIGWIAAYGATRRSFRPQSLAPAGIIIWLATVAGGMLLRAASKQGVAFSFIVVATIATAVLILGWRLLFGLAERRRAA